MVVLEHSTKPFSTFDLSCNGIDMIARINQFVAESLMRWLASFRNPSSQSVRLRQACFIHVAFGLGVIPAKWTRRVFKCITVSTSNVTSLLRVQTSTVVKSVAKIESQWAFRNVDQDAARWRSGAGSMPCALSTFATVESAMW